MKKGILNLGTSLAKTTQKNIFGGNIFHQVCNCNPITGKWSFLSCGLDDCRDQEVKNDNLPIDLVTFCLMNPNDPIC